MQHPYCSIGITEEEFWMKIQTGDPYTGFVQGLGYVIPHPDAYVIKPSNKLEADISEKSWYQWVFTEGTLGTSVSSTFFDRVGARRWSPTQWRSAKGIVYSSQILQKNPNTGKFVRGVQGYRKSFNWAKQKSAPFRHAGKALGVASMGITVWDMADNGINAGNSLDLIMGGVAFIPKVGWVISGIYVIVDYTLVKTTDKKLGNHLEEAWQTSSDFAIELYNDIKNRISTFFERLL